MLFYYIVNFAKQWDRKMKFRSGKYQPRPFVISGLWFRRRNHRALISLLDQYVLSIHFRWGERGVESWMFLLKFWNTKQCHWAIHIIHISWNKTSASFLLCIPLILGSPCFPKACKSYAGKRMHDKLVPLKQAILWVRIWYTALQNVT